VSPYRLVWRNLMRHPIRVVLTFLFATIALFSFGFLRSIVTTLDSAVKGAAADRVAVQSAVSLYVSLPRSYRERISQVEGVESVCPWTWFGGRYQSPENFFAQFGCDLEVLLSQYPEVEIAAGDRQDLFREKRACLIGQGLSDKYGWKVGDTVPLIGTIYPKDDGTAWEFTVRAIYRSHRPNIDEKTMFFHWDYLQDMRLSIRATSDGTSRQEVSVYMVKVKEGARPEAVIAAIDALFEGGPQKTRTQTESAFQAQFVSMLGNIPTFLSWIGGAVLFAIFFAVLNTAGMAARERSRDVGLLKALGFTDRFASRILLIESMAVVGLGGCLGVALSYLAAPGFREAFGTQLPNYHVLASTGAIGVGIALAIGLLGGILPSFRLARLRTVDVLREGA
jgi:putative ABC transport system permease protein